MVSVYVLGHRNIDLFGVGRVELAITPANPNASSTTGDRQPQICFKQISFGYQGRKLILDKLDFTLYAGERVGLLGPNGSGKTTLLHIIMGLLKPLSGEIQILGRPVRAEKDFREVYRKVGLLFQDADDQLFCPTVLEDVAFGPLNLNKSKAEAIAIAQKTLAYLGLSGFEHRVTHQLSGGEKRLVALATVLAMEPEVLLLDEPSTGLDDETRTRLGHVLTHIHQSYILISHESHFMQATANTFYRLENGKLTRQEIIHAHPHTHPHSGHNHHQ